MSLLMDALRKAEQAKRQAESAAKRGGPQSQEPESAAAEDAAQHAEPGAPLPELPSKLELLDDQFGDVTTSPAPVRRPSPAAAPKPAAEDVERERQAAQQLFAAKEPEPPSRRGFYTALAGATLAAVIGIGGYFWWQLQPRSTLLAGPKPEQRVAAKPAAAPPPASAPASPGTGPTVPPAARAPGALAVAGVGGPRAAPAAAESELREEPAAGRRPRSPRPAIERGQLADPPTSVAAADPPIRLVRSRPQTDPALERAYRSYQAGKPAAARADYEQVLRRDPHNVDALNGLAAVALASGDPQTAEAWYRRALEADPRDPTAQAGLMGLRGDTDPVQTEGRLKTLAAAQPDAHAAQFTLGNLYASQGRWHEAQEAYFRALTADPDNPDYQFNLAVSLDQLRQPRLAQQYYEGALAAAATRPGAFDRARAAARIRELNQP